MTAAAATNKEIQARRAAVHGGVTVKTVIPLNRYSFFEEQANNLLPQMLLTFEIELESDDKTIFQNEGTGQRIVVNKIALWVPKLLLTPEGKKLVNKNFLKPTKLSYRYLKEPLTPGSDQRDACRQW